MPTLVLPPPLYAKSRGVHRYPGSTPETSLDELLHAFEGQFDRRLWPRFVPLDDVSLSVAGRRTTLRRDAELRLSPGDTVVLLPVADRRLDPLEHEREVRLTLAAAQYGDATAMRQLAELYERRGELRGAARTYELAADGGELRAWRLLGRLHERNGEIPAAIDAYRAGAEDDPIAQRQLGALFERTGDVRASLDAYERAADRGDVISRRLMGQLLAGQGDHSRAAVLLEQAVAEGDTIALRLLGTVHRETGDHSRAAATYEEAAQHGDVRAWRLLGQLHLERGDQGAAIGAFERGATAGDRVALDALERIAPSVAARVPQSSGARARDAASADADPDADPDDADAPLDSAGGMPAVVARMVNDLPTLKDLLGIRPLVNGLALLLDDKRTKLPLALAITGPWGSGKSSVMRQLEHELAPAGRADGPHDGPRWHKVRFDAWKYERRERLWAALATAIYEQPQQDLSWSGRLAFRVRLEWLRRRPLGFLRSFLWPLPIAVAGAAVALATGVQAVGIASVSSTLLAVATSASVTVGLLTDPFKRAMRRYARTPDYGETLGFTEQADHDIDCLLQALTRDEHKAVAVFVDDLDRCSSEHVVEVVETMNQIFNSRRDRRCLFVLGMDRTIVAAAIEVAYGDIVQRLEHRKSPLAASFGMHFLAKLVQLSVTVPPPRQDAMRALLDDIAIEDEALTAPADIGPEVAAELAIREQEPGSLEQVGEIGERLRSRGVQPLAVERAERRVRAELISGDSSDVLAAEAEVVSCIEANPRQLKRLDNAFRLQLYVASEADNLRFSPDQLVALARWVAMRLRWPDLTHALDDEPALLAALEARANGEDAGPDDAEPLVERHAAWFAERDLTALLRDRELERRISALPFDTFLHVA